MEKTKSIFKDMIKNGDPRLLDPALREISDKDIKGYIDTLLKPAKRKPGRKKPAPQQPLRWQDPLIEREIAGGSSVLDLGCGDGELLYNLIHRRRVKGQGVELDPAAVFACVGRGVPVIQADLDTGLKGFKDKSFDYVVLEETLQTLHRPLDILRDMLRVGKRGIVSFPNFAHWKVRLDLATRGRMPMTEWLPVKWYDSPNIHLFSLQDLLDWIKESKVKVVHGYILEEGKVNKLDKAANLTAEEALLVLEKK